MVLADSGSCRGYCAALLPPGGAHVDRRDRMLILAWSRQEQLKKNNKATTTVAKITDVPLKDARNVGDIFAGGTIRCQ